MPDALAPFSPATQQWFRNAFGTPTAAQEGAWESISKGENALIIAPTGSGKTLAAFLWALDALYRDKSTEPGQRELTASAQGRKNGGARETQKTKKQRAGGTRILYVSRYIFCRLNNGETLRGALKPSKWYVCAWYIPGKYRAKDHAQ